MIATKRNHVHLDIWSDCSFGIDLETINASASKICNTCRHASELMNFTQRGFRSHYWWWQDIGLYMKIVQIIGGPSDVRVIIRVNSNNLLMTIYIHALLKKKEFWKELENSHIIVVNCEMRVLSSSLVELPEAETWYVVNVVKHVYPGSIVYHFNCTCTIAEHTLENGSSTFLSNVS